MNKTYIGDGAYVEIQGDSIVLTTRDGYSETNRVVLEPEVLRSLLDYLEHLKPKKTVMRVADTE